MLLSELYDLKKYQDKKWNKFSWIEMLNSLLDNDPFWEWLILDMIQRFRHRTCSGYAY
jgi:hypothetical protein